MFASKAVAGAFLAVLSFANAAPHQMERRAAAGLEVILTEAGPTEVKATVKNNGNEVMRLFTGGTVLDDLPVKKLIVHRDSELATFTGIVAEHASQGLPEEEFVTLVPGASTSAIINIASTWELTEGEYSIQSIDAIPFALVNSTSLAGAYEYESNVLHMNINAADIASVAQAIGHIDKRTVTQCSNPEKDAALKTALNNAVFFSVLGSYAALYGSADKFSEYFDTTDAEVRNNVAARFRAIAYESHSTTEGSTTYFCEDPQDICKSSIIAYCLPSRNIIANCPIFYELPAMSRGQGDQSQASTVIHEMAHAPGVFGPGTQDHAYGYQASTGLSTQQALDNADNYALFADCAALGC